MPRIEDIAWKFVIRQGKKWRCPYCKNEYSGSVTRVKSHFRKQPKEGIVSCTKVPEHISTLMELLQNQVDNKDDIAWKFVDRLGENKWHCHHCKEEFLGDLAGVKGHLLGVPTERISICTEVPDPIITLMRSLLDEVAEEESRGANGQSSMEPRSHDMPAQAEVGEDESRGTSHQFSTEPQSRGMLPPAIFSPPQVFECTEHLFIPREETDMANLTSDQQQGERQSHRSLAMPSLVRNSHATIETCVSQQPSSHWQTSRDAAAFQPQRHLVPATGLHDPDIFQQSNQSQQSCDAESDEIALLNQQLSMDWVASPSLDSNHPPQLFDQSVQGNGQQHLSASSSLPDEVAEEQSREAHGQSSMEPQSRDTPTQPSPVWTPESLEYARTLLPTPRGASHVANFTQHGVIGLNSDQQSQAERQLRQSSAMPLFVQSSHVKPALASPQHQSVLRQSINQEIRYTQQNATIPLDNLDTTRQPDLCDSPPENLAESRDVIVNALEEIQTNEQHNPTVGSSLQNDLSLDVDHTNRLLDWSQPCAVEGVPLFSNTNPTNAVEHPDQLYPRCDEEDGNDTRLFLSPTPMDIDHSIASLHSSDCHDNLQVLEAATDAIAPSSSQDLDRGYPIMTVWSINANDEEIRNLKRKVKELDDKEADVKENMEIESSSSVRKKPRTSVEKWLNKTERARNDFQIIGQANGETLPPKEQVVTLTREVEELIKQALPQPLLIEERDAKGVKFLERKLTGEAINMNIELIWRLLKENRACKLGIYGMGGVGKTTITMQVHNRLLEDATFDGVVFVTVSKDFSIYKLQSDIGKALKFCIPEDEHEKKRAAMLSEHLERKKNCVLILDDVWKNLNLEEVGIPIRAHGFKMVLTTRSFNVCCQMRCQEKIKIKPLCQKEAESLFLEELEPEVPLNMEIKKIVKSIVEECAGLPIGIITMARSMRGVTKLFEWRDFLVKLKESSMGQTDMEKVLMNLKFSYDWLRDPVVQQCFLSCALYPEDELINKIELIEFFIDQGLIGGLNTRKETYDRGLTILKRLGNGCLLEDHGSKMKMHDLIRDMALHITSTTSIVKAGKGLTRIPPEEYWTNALEKVSLMENKISEFPSNMSPNCPKLATLLLNSSLEYNVVIPDFFFNQLRGLKVLNLSRCHIRELPNSISKLVNLRALLLRECIFLCRIPYLGKLKSIKKLDARNCISLEALEGLEKLVNLRYLDLTQTRIERLPKGTLDHLLNLQCLEVSAVNEEDITKFGGLEAFGLFLESVDDLNRYVSFIEQNDNPRYGEFHRELKKLRYTMDTQFGNLERRSVYIQNWDHAIVSVGGKCTGIFILIPREVQIMAMISCDGMTNLSSMGPLEYLEELDIISSKNLEALYGGQDEEVINIHDSPAAAPTLPLFSSLRDLSISNCPRLKYLFGHGSKSNLPHLQKIRIQACNEMVRIIAEVTSAPPHPLPFFPSLEEISVIQCDKMKRAVESEWMPHFPILRRIYISGCEKMEEIIGGPLPYLPIEGISLESLYVWYGNMRKLLSHEWLLHLRNLQSIEVYFCRGMVEMISGAGQGQEGSITTPVNNTPLSFQPSSISLPKLERLKLRDLPQLKSICEVLISCDSMKELTVQGCPELKRIPLQLRLCKIEELPHIWVDDEKKWKTLMWDLSLPDAQAILRPYLRKGEHVNKESISLWEQSYPNAIELSTKGEDLALEESPATMLS